MDALTPARMRAAMAGIDDAVKAVAEKTGLSEQAVTIGGGAVVGLALNFLFDFKHPILMGLAGAGLGYAYAGSLPATEK